MVMETPTPQCVGLEFVRQYYTVLNKAPLHLHRFFSHNSSFLHGGHTSMSEPIVGQADIHKVIMGLNFRDCHAKIRMVDAQATLDNGVVIQVTGELSNNGNPMRRFMQTFVLAPQTPKKYYVHNDIFRYQDEVFSDEEGGEEGGSDGEEELEPPLPTQGFTAPTPTTTPTITTLNGAPHPPEPEPTPTPPAPAPAPSPATPQAPTAVPVTPVVLAAVPGASPPTVPSAPIVTPALSPTPPAPTVPEAAAPERPPTPEKEQEGWSRVAPPSTDNWGPDTQSSSWEDIAAPPKETPEPDPPQPDPIQHQPVSTEPKTYANLFKSSQGFPPAPTSAPTASQQPTAPPPAPNTAPHQPPAMNRVEMNSRPPPTTTTPAASATPTPGSGGMGMGNQPPSQPGGGGGYNQRNPRAMQGSRGPPRDRPYRPNSEDNTEMGYFSSRPTDSLGGEEKRRPLMPDSQQIFVGNLPHTAGEEELKTEFSRFGKIMDIRINTAKGKTGPKGQVPNFGFITFEEESTVTRVLDSRPIHLNGEHRLNVEEKKARLRMDGGMGRPTSGRGGGMGGFRQGPPGGMQGRGGSRPNYSRDNNRGGPRGGFIPRR